MACAPGGAGEAAAAGTGELSLEEVFALTKAASALLGDDMAHLGKASLGVLAAAQQHPRRASWEGEGRRVRGQGRGTSRVASVPNPADILELKTLRTHVQLLHLAIVTHTRRSRMHACTRKEYMHDDRSQSWSSRRAAPRRTHATGRGGYPERLAADRGAQHRA